MAVFSTGSIAAPDWAEGGVSMKHGSRGSVCAIANGHASPLTQSIGLHMTRFHAEMADRIYPQRVQEHRRAGKLSHLHTTPDWRDCPWGTEATTHPTR
jgi:hypothetical protein